MGGGDLDGPRPRPLRHEPLLVGWDDRVAGADEVRRQLLEQPGHPVLLDVGDRFRLDDRVAIVTGA